MFVRVTAALAQLLVLAVLAAIAYLCWAVATSPMLLKQFVESTFLQAIAAIGTMVATTLLVIVTRRLVVVTRQLEVATDVQTHANTAPLLVIGAFAHHDPVEEGEGPASPPYSFAETDQQNREYMAFLSEVPADTQPIYLVIVGYNSQTQGSYGIAMDVEIDVVLSFPRIAYMKTLEYGAFDPAEIHEYQRTIAFEALFGNFNSAAKAFRIDPLPWCGFRVTDVRYRNFRGRPARFTFGVKQGFYTPDKGLSVTTGKFDPLPGEIPS